MIGGTTRVFPFENEFFPSILIYSEKKIITIHTVIPLPETSISIRNSLTLYGCI